MQPTTAPDVSTRRGSSARYAVGLLFAVYTLNYLDRQIVNILVEPIKRDLGLADWQLGMISGLAFAVFYTTLGIPLARWADGPRNDRVTLISWSLAAWSAMTVICGFAVNFGQMMAARIGVGVGEAGCSPAAHSLISDVVPSERRATALGIYSLGIPMGKLGGMALGGWIAHNHGWRAAFLVVGAPGILLAILARLTLVDPRRNGGPSADVSESLLQVWSALRRVPLFWLATVACSLTSFVSLGSSAFLGSFLIRTHHLPVDRAGLWLGLAIGVGGAVGAWLGGVTCDYLGRRYAQVHMLLPGAASLGGGALLAFGVMANETDVALALLSLSAVFTSFWYGPVFSAVQGVAPQASRATAAAIHLFVVNAVGFGLGPIFIGALSDALSVGDIGLPPLGQADGLRWSIVIATSATVAAAALFAAAARYPLSTGRNVGVH